VLKVPEQRRGRLEAKANLGSAALPLTKVDDSAILLLASGDISQEEPFAQFRPRWISSFESRIADVQCELLIDSD
jgi:hypothetical protein